MAKTASRQATIFINGKEIEDTLKGVRAAWAQVNNELNLLVIGTEEYEAKMEELKKLDSIIADHRAALKGTAEGYSLLQSGVASFVAAAAGAFTVDAIIGYGKELFNTATRLEQMEKKAKTVFAETLPSITREAEKNAAAMGLTTSQYIEQAAGIQDLLVPMGFQRQEAAGITAQLVNLSGALAEWSGGQVSAEDVSKRLSAALLGERESLKELGIAISQADVDARVAANGQKELTGKMKEQAEAAATLQLILEKSTDAQAAYAQNAGSSIRTQAELAARFQEVSEKLAVALIPVFERLLDVAASVAEGLNFVADVVGDLSDPVGAATKAFDDQAAKVADLEKNMVPLLDRYDALQEKGNLNAKEQDELNRIITTVAETVPSAVTAFDKYGKALGLNTDKAREFIEVERKRLQFVNSEGIKTIEEETANLERQASMVKTLLDTRQKYITVRKAGGEIEQKAVAATDNDIAEASKELGALQTRIDGAKAQIARLKGEDIATPAAPTTPDSDGTGDDKELSDKAKREAERIQKELTALLEKQLALRREMLDAAAEDDGLRAIRAIEKRYDAEIKKATELEADGVGKAKAIRLQLEQEKATAVEAEIERQATAVALKAEEQAREIVKAAAKGEAEEAAATEAFKAEREAGRKAAADQFAQFAAQEKVQTQAAEIAELDAHFLKLLALAEEYGISTVEITAAYNAKKDAINKEYAEKQTSYQRQVAEAEAQLQVARAGAIEQGAAMLAGFFEENSAIARALFLVEKGAAAAAIIINLQKEKAAIWAAARLGTPFDPTGVAAAALAIPQVASAKIRAGIGLATIAATAIGKFVAPKTKQKFGGGLLPVTGETDGQRYLAQAIAAPNTGLLPHFPVLFQSAATGAPVLASERGAEYFIAAHDLQRPAVANLVRMIDILTQRGGSVRQFADGGAALPSDAPPPATSGLDAALLRELAGAVKGLTAIIAGGRVIAVVPDQTVVDISDRLRVLDDVSGGYFG